MISNFVKSSKTQLVRSIQSLRNPLIETFEVIDEKSRKDIIQKINGLSKKSNFSIIFVKDK